MLTMYICFLIGGAIFPIVSALLGFFGDGADAELDTGTDLDVGIDGGSGLDADPGMSLDAGTGMDMEIEINTGFDADTGVNLDAGMGMGSDMTTNIDTDAGQMFSLGLFPSSLMALSALTITFGAVGGIMTYAGKGRLLTLTVSVITGYAASVVVQTIIKTLRRLQTRNYGINENELLLYDGKVVDTILPGQLGTVSFTTLKNVRVSYPAKCSDVTRRLAAGKIVKVKEFKDGIFIVEPKNKYEK